MSLQARACLMFQLQWMIYCTVNSSVSVPYPQIQEEETVRENI